MFHWNRHCLNQSRWRLNFLFFHSVWLSITVRTVYCCMFDLVDCLLVQNVQHISRPCVKSVVTHLCRESSRTTHFRYRRINRRKRQAQAQEWRACLDAITSSNFAKQAHAQESKLFIFVRLVLVCFNTFLMKTEHGARARVVLSYSFINQSKHSF